MISISLNVNQSLAQAVGDFLLENGALSVSFEDSDLNTEKEEAIFGEDPDEAERFWNNTNVISLFESLQSIQSISIKLFSIYQIPSEAIKIKNIEDKDWVKETQSQFEPIKINEKIWIIPSWHQVQNNNALNIHLDPGLAFGTGSHPTTKLCLDWLSKLDLKKRSVLDYGCGSGILAIAANKLGANKTVGIDIDSQAILSSNQNAKKNNTTDIKFFTSDSLLSESFDIVVANILSSALKVLSPLITAKCNSGGKIALSGILESQEDEVKEFYHHSFFFDKSIYLDGWVCLIATKKS